MISDAISVKNIVGYRKYQTNQFDDVGGSRLPISQSGISQRGDQFSEELQLLGEAGKLNWIVGGYYLREHVRSYTDARSTLGPLHEGINNPANAFENVNNTSKSLFGSGTFGFGGGVDGLSATLGARYTWDTRYAQWGRVNAVGFAQGQPTPGGAPSPGARCAFPATVPGRLPFPDCTVARSVDYGRLASPAPARIR